MQNFFKHLAYDILVGIGVLSVGLFVAFYMVDAFDNYMDRRMCGEIRSVIKLNSKYAITKFTEAECNSVGIYVGKANAFVNEK